jgi:prolyl 4-hydroxylase
VIEGLKRDAKKGDARAQYALSELLFNDGNKAEALEWLASAVRADLPDACFTMATFQMAGLSVQYDAEGARHNLSRASDLGHTDAKLLLSQLSRTGYGGQKDAKTANELLLTLAKQDHPIALCGVGMLLYIRSAPIDTVDTLLEQAANKGSHIAAYIQAHKKNEAELAGDVAGRNDRIRYLVLSSNAGNRLAEAELVAYEKKLVQESLNSGRLLQSPKSEVDFDRIEELIQEDVEYVFDEPEILSADNNILIYKSFLTPLECAYIRAAAAATIQPSSTIHPLTGKFIKNEIRTSSSSNFDPVSRDCVIYAIEERIAAATDTNVDQGESLNVLYYRVGEEYKYHYDHLPEGGKEEITFLKESGQRKYTFLVSMNEGYLGGETYFPDLDVTYRGKLGDALMFQNLHSDGAANKLMRHAGLPLKEGCKWVASKWIREKKFNFGTPSHQPE